VNGFDEALQAVTAAGVLLTGLGGVRTRKKVDRVHNEVKTTNGHTLGELVETVVAPAVTEGQADTPEPQPSPPPRDGPPGRG
jgi:hypothetical protein